MTELRPATSEDAGAVAEIWYLGWQDAHRGNVPDDLVVARTKESFWERAAQRVGDTVVALLGAAEQQVAANGHGKAWLAVVAGNARARKFYERQGWTDEGRFDHEAPSDSGPILVPAHRYVKSVQ